MTSSVPPDLSGRPVVTCVPSDPCRAGGVDRDARSVQVFDGGSDRALLSALSRFTAYMVTVTAYNSRGPGPASEPVSAKTAEDAPDRPPAEVSCAAASTDTLTVTWTPPEVNHRSAGVTEIRSEPAFCTGASTRR